MLFFQVNASVPILPTECNAIDIVPQELRLNSSTQIHTSSMWPNISSGSMRRNRSLLENLLTVYAGSVDGPET